MEIIGQYSTTGEYMAYTTPIVVYPLGNALKDEDGQTVAIRDESGDWVSPTMRRLGLKSKIEVSP